MTRGNTGGFNKFRISPFLPYFSSYIILLGVTRLIFFYSEFGVPIINYLDFTEIITSFLDYIVFTLLSFSLSALFGFIIYDRDSQVEKNNLRIKLSDEPTFKKRFWMYFSLYKDLIILSLTMNVIFILWYFFKKEIELSEIFWMNVFFVLCFIVLILITEGGLVHKKINSSVYYKRFISFLLIILISLSLVIYSAHSQAERIKKHKLTTGVSITLDNDQSIVSDSTNYYIGKTLNYIFIFHENDSSVDVIPMSRVKQLKLKNNYSKRNVFNL